MSKNPSISEGSQAKNFNNTKKLETNLVGGGTQLWIPEDEAGLYAKLANKSIDANGVYIAANEGKDGYSSISVNVPFNLASKDVLVNGTYYAEDDGVAGYSSVNVNVSSGGGGGVGNPNYHYPLQKLSQAMPSGISITARKTRGGVELNGRIYTLFYINGYYCLYSTNNGAWSRVTNNAAGDIPQGFSARDVALFNGNIYTACARTSGGATAEAILCVFNGSTFVKVCDIPHSGSQAQGDIVGFGNMIYNSNGWIYTGGTNWVQSVAAPSGTIGLGAYKGIVYALVYSSKIKLVKLNGNSWSDVVITPLPYQTAYANLFEHKNRLHIFSGGYHYTYNGKFVRSEEQLQISGSGFQLQGAGAAPLGNDIYIMGASGGNQYKATYTE